MAIQTINNGESGSAVRSKLNSNFNELATTSGSPGGTDTQVQFNDGGVFGGANGWTWNKATNTMTLASGTQTANNPAQTITQTWNNAGATFTGLRLNVTDTASNANSLLMDLQNGNASRFSVSKNAVLRLANSVGGSSVLDIQGFTLGFFRIGSGLYTNPVTGETGATSFGFGAGYPDDTKLFRDAANTLAQRNGTNAQTFRLYNSFTDASNYERGFMRWNSNVLEIGAESAGTGVSRAINLGGGLTVKDGAFDKKVFFNFGGTVFGASNIPFYNDRSYGAEFLDPYGFSSGFHTAALLVTELSDRRRSLLFDVDPIQNLGVIKTGFVGFGVGAFPGISIATGVEAIRILNGGNVGINTTAPTEKLEVNGNIKSTGHTELSEMTAPAAPATNGVRIYAEDNGAGKTRLMARFATGAAVQIAIEP